MSRPSAGFLKTAYILDTYRKGTVLAIIEVILQGLIDGWKRQLCPGDFLLREEPGFQAFRAHPETRFGQRSYEENVNLTDVGEVENRIEAVQIYWGSGFLQRFPAGSFKGGLTVLHKPGRQGPETLAWLDRTSTKQNSIALKRQRASNNARVLVVNMGAMRANMAFAIVALRNDQLNRIATLAAEFHG